MKDIIEFNTQEWGFASNFVNFFQFYSHVLENKEKKKLRVNTYLNPIRNNYNILSVFELDNSAIDFTDSKFIYTYSFKNTLKRFVQGELDLKNLADIYFKRRYKDYKFKYPVHNAFSILTNDKLRGIAKLNKSTLDKLIEIDDNNLIIKTFDLGIHLRYGDKVKEIEENSREASEKTRTNEEVITEILNNSKYRKIFIASDDLIKAKEMIQKINPNSSITLYHQVNNKKAGHDQSQFNKQNVEQKEKQFFEFLLDCHILSKCSLFLGSVNSNITYFVAMMDSKTKILTYDGEISYL